MLIAAYAGKVRDFKAWLKEQKEGLKMETAVDYNKVYRADRKRYGSKVIVIGTVLMDLNGVSEDPAQQILP